MLGFLAKVRTFREVKSAKSDGCFSSFNPIGVLLEYIIMEGEAGARPAGFSIKKDFGNKLRGPWIG